MYKLHFTDEEIQQVAELSDKDTTSKSESEYDDDNDEEDSIS
jgi:hypothetical protein